MWYIEHYIPSLNTNTKAIQGVFAVHEELFRDDGCSNQHNVCIEPWTDI